MSCIGAGVVFLLFAVLAYPRFEQVNGWQLSQDECGITAGFRGNEF